MESVVSQRSLASFARDVWMLLDGLEPREEEFGPAALLDTFLLFLSLVKWLHSQTRNTTDWYRQVKTAVSSLAHAVTRCVYHLSAARQGSSPTPLRQRRRRIRRMRRTSVRLAFVMTGRQTHAADFRTSRWHSSRSMLQVNTQTGKEDGKRERERERG